jgi:hypothetical protein
MSVVEFIYNADDILPKGRKLEAQDYMGLEKLLRKDEQLFMVYLNNVRGLPREASLVHTYFIFKMTIDMFAIRQELKTLLPWEGYYAVKTSDLVGLSYRMHQQPEWIIRLIIFLKNLLKKPKAPKGEKGV